MEVTNADGRWQVVCRWQAEVLSLILLRYFLQVIRIDLVLMIERVTRDYGTNHPKYSVGERVWSKRVVVGN
jgi:hypothetical protein